MLKILLVDDEILIRKGLSKAIGRNTDFVVVGEAGDGFEAVNLIEQLEPDVVITDIRMPEMNGQELVKFLSEKYPGIKKVVLSGFEDFIYVRDTMKNGAEDYFLKPVDDHQLHELLKNIHLKIGLERKSREARIEQNIKINQSSAFLRDQFLSSLITTNNSEKVCPELLAKLRYYGIQVQRTDKFTIVLISIDNYRHICCKHGSEEGKTDYFIIRKISEEVAGEKCGFFSCQTEAGVAAFLNTENIAAIRDISDSIYCNLKKYTKIRFTVVIAASAKGITDLNSLYNEACLYMDYRYYKQESSIIDSNRAGGLPNWNTVNESFKTDFEKKLESCVELTKPEEVNGIFSDLACYAGSKYINPGEIFKMLSDTYLKLRFKLNDFRRAIGEVFEDEYSFLKELEKLDTFDQIQKLSVSFYIEVINRIINIRSKKAKKMIEVVRDYISEHYSEEISLSRIAEVVFVNPNYFCDMFKNITGENFIDYLTRYRIDKAKELLKDMSVKTYEIGRMVGYEDSNYFSKVFKKVVGISPSQYRNIVL